MATHSSGDRKYLPGRPSMYATRLQKESLDTLPNEVLHMIVSSFPNRPCIPRRYRVITTLSQVNRRLRYFTLPYLLREIVVPSDWDLEDFITKSPGTWLGFDVAQLVRSIRFARRRLSTLLPRSLTLNHSIDDLPLCPNLATFECLCGSITPEEMRILATHISPNIQSLTLVWPLFRPYSRPGRFVEEELSPLQKFSALKTLRLHVEASPTVIGHPSLSFAFPSLDTLSIENAGLWPDFFHFHARLPNLRVLNLQGVTSNPLGLYRFVHLHSTLREVNVTFTASNDRVYLGPLIKLIADTTPWIGAAGVHDRPGSVVVHDYDSEYARGFWASILLDGFAFARSPIDTASNLDLQSQPSFLRNAAYIPTSLALRFAEIQDASFHGPNWESIFLEIFSIAKIPLLNQIEYLSLDSEPIDRWWGEDIDHSDMIGDWCNGLKAWTSLRKLCFSATCDSWEGIGNYSSTNLPSEVFRCYWELGRVHPPVFGRSRILTFDNDYRRRNVDVVCPDAMAKLCEIAQIVDHEDINRPHIGLMPVWEACWESTVRYGFCDIAKVCPKLEEIEWYPGEPKVVLWHWKVTRRGDEDVGGSLNPETNGTRRTSDIYTMQGRLYWVGSIRGQHPRAAAAIEDTGRPRVSLFEEIRMLLSEKRRLRLFDAYEY